MIDNDDDACLEGILEKILSTADIVSPFIHKFDFFTKHENDQWPIQTLSGITDADTSGRLNTIDAHDSVENPGWKIKRKEREKKKF